MVRLRAQAGFSLLELMLSATVLGIVMVFFSFFVRGQIAGMKKSEQLSNATQVAIGALEKCKNELADSARFRERFDGTDKGPDEDFRTASMNKMDYSITLSYARAADPLYALKVQARVRWNKLHSVKLGVLVPGPGGLVK